MFLQDRPLYHLQIESKAHVAYTIEKTVGLKKNIHPSKNKNDLEKTLAKTTSASESEKQSENEYENSESYQNTK